MEGTQPTPLGQIPMSVGGQSESARESARFIEFLIYLCGLMATPMEVILFRHTLGERRFSVVQSFLCWLVLGFSLLGIGALTANLVLLIADPLRFIFLTMNSALIVIYALVASWHQAKILQRRRNGVLIHSYSFGYSRIADLAGFLGIKHPLLTTDWILFRLTEPTVCLIIGMLMSRFDPVIGSYIVLASFCLFLKNNLIYARARSRILDMIDASIEAKYISAALEGKPKRETAGFAVAPVSPGIFVASQVPDMAAAVTETMRPAEASANGYTQTELPDFAATVEEAMAKPGSDPTRAQQSNDGE